MESRRSFSKSSFGFGEIRNPLWQGGKCLAVSGRSTGWKSAFRQAKGGIPTSIATFTWERRVQRRCAPLGPVNRLADPGPINYDAAMKPVKRNV